MDLSLAWPHLARWRNGALAGCAGACADSYLPLWPGMFRGRARYKTPDGTAIFRLNEHTDNLFRSAHILRMDMPFDKQTQTRTA